MSVALSFVIPVYNRPDEVFELLSSLACQQGDYRFEVVIVEDGSTQPCKQVCDGFMDASNGKQLEISYYFKANSGPGDSRNYGMQKAKGDYFIILDSDCILPTTYVSIVNEYLGKKFVHCFGGPDAAHYSFSAVQKAIDFSMTSLLTTGGIRGKKTQLGTFQPRSFNMGLSKAAFLATGGFGKIHPGEDPDLVFRLWQKGFETHLFAEAYVYHKRRINWSKFHTQVQKFGLVRPILNVRYPEYEKYTFWLPSVFCVGVIVAIILAFIKVFAPLLLVLAYFTVVWITALSKTKNLKVAMLSICAVLVQFFGYGLAFLKSTFYVKWLKKDARHQFPNLFFD